ncbi:MAG: DUF2938 family protein, partial [Burkholderiaceae bacterium]
MDTTIVMGVIGSGVAATLALDLWQRLVFRLGGYPASNWAMVGRWLVVLLRLALEPGAAPTYAELGAELGLTASEAHAAVERAVAARLAVKDEAGKASVVRAALKSFVQHGARYCFPATQGALSRGVP